MNPPAATDADRHAADPPAGPVLRMYFSIFLLKMPPSRAVPFMAQPDATSYLCHTIIKTSRLDDSRSCGKSDHGNFTAFE
jgi:hypothetical protein